MSADRTIILNSLHVGTLQNKIWREDIHGGMGEVATDKTFRVWKATASFLRGMRFSGNENQT